MKKRPSVLKIINVDYPAMLATMVLIAFLGTLLLNLLFLHNPLTDLKFWAIILVVLVVSALVLYWRIRRIFDLFSDGLETSATISNASIPSIFVSEFGEVEYTITYLGQSYAIGNKLRPTKQTRSLKAGDQIIVLIDPNNPKRAAIRDLYI